MFEIELQPEEHIYNFSLRTNIPDCPEAMFSIHTQYELTGNEFPGLFLKGRPSETNLNRLEVKPQQIRGDQKKDLPAPYGGNKDTGRGGQSEKTPSYSKKDTPWYKCALLILVILGILVVLGGCYYFFFYDKKGSFKASDGKIDIENYPKIDSNAMEDVQMMKQPLNHKRMPPLQEIIALMDIM